MTTETLRPNAAGDLTGIHNQYPATGSHWDKVDEAVADEDATYVDTGGYITEDIDLYNLPAHSTGCGVINHIKVYVRCRHYGVGGGGYAEVRIKTNGAVKYGSQNALTNSWTTYSHQWDTNPVTAAPWTWDEIDALQIGVKLTDNYGNDEVRCTQVYVEIDYTEVPLLTTEAVDDITQTTATFNGTVTDVGEANPTVRGFVFDTESHNDPGNVAPADSEYFDPLNEYETHETDAGGFAAEAYDLPITDLNSGTTYYVRSYAMNTAGYSYGNEVSFVTLGTPFIPSEWAKRIKIDIDYTTCIGASVDWFPIDIIIESGLAGVGDKDVSCIFDELQNDGNRKKIAVVKSDGLTPLYVEIEQWDTAGENAVLHCSREAWNINSDTFVYIYYDSTHADNDDWVGDLAARPEVWDDYFNAVYHMVNDNGNVDDSTLNSVDGTKQGAGHPAEVAGKIAEAQHFDAVQDYIALANDSFSGDNVGTIEAWIKRDLDARNDPFVSSSDEDAKDLFYLRAYGGTDRKLTIQFYHVDGSTVSDVICGDTTLGTGWRHVAVTSNGSAWILYLDGVSDGINVVAGSNSGLWFNDLSGNVHAVKIGAMTYSLGTEYMDGIIDELRISSVARSAAWIKGTHCSGNDSLLTYGDEEVLTGLGKKSGNIAAKMLADGLI